MTYLFSPSEVLAGRVPAGTSFRLGGTVRTSAAARPASLKVEFVVTDRFHEMPVRTHRDPARPVSRGQVASPPAAPTALTAARDPRQHDETHAEGVADAIAKAKMAKAQGGAQ
jgi:cytochrome c-type biogenesis protein CcmE